MLICMRCEIEMRPENNGVVLVSMDSRGMPHSAHESDLWKCPDCGHQVISGIAKDPCDAHWNGKGEGVVGSHEAFAARLEAMEEAGSMVIRYWMNSRERDESRESQVVLSDDPCCRTNQIGMITAHQRVATDGDK